MENVYDEIPTGLENGITLQKFKKMRHDGQLSRRSSLNKLLSLTPLQHSTEYTPVYANRAANTVNDEKNSKILDGNTMQLEDWSNALGNNFVSKEINDKILNDSLYALYRPRSFRGECSKFETNKIFAKGQHKDNEVSVTSTFDNQVDSEVKQSIGNMKISRTLNIIDTNPVDGKKIHFF